MTKNPVFGSILLIGGTAIGAGMLALPANTAHSGFGPTLLLLCICWLFMTIAAFYILEVNLWLDGENDLMSMAGLTLGKIGQTVTAVLFLALFYSLISSYLQASSAWVVSLLEQYNQTSISSFSAVLGLILIFGCFVCYGTAIVDKFNRWLTLGLVVAYCLLIGMSVPYIHLDNLIQVNFETLPPVLPMMITAFGFSVIIPTLKEYLNHEPKALMKAIFIGSLLPLMTYIVWLWVTLGTFPAFGPESLRELIGHTDAGTGVAKALESVIQSSVITYSAKFFSIFAIFTSLLGVALGLFHFIADALKWPINNTTRFPLLLLTFGPCLLFIHFYPTGFDRILSFAGLFVALLLGAIPALMAYSGRYQLGYNKDFRVMGGKPLLLLTLLFFIGVVTQELMNCWL